MRSGPERKLMRVNTTLSANSLGENPSRKKVLGFGNISNHRRDMIKMHVV